MTGLRSLDRDVGRLQISDFAHHDDVRILPQERLQRRRKGQPSLVVHVDLVDAGQLDFRWVFGGGDIDVALVQPVQERVQRHGFARSGWPRHEHHAVRPLDDVEQQLLLLRLIAKLVDIEPLGGRLQNPDHDLFAEQRRQRRHPEVDGALDRLFVVLVLAVFRDSDQQLHAAVLRHTLFRDVEARQHLDARRDLVADIERRLRDLREDAVDAETHAVKRFKGLEMQIRCAAQQGFGKELLQEAHHRGIVDAVGGGATRGGGSARIVFDLRGFLLGEERLDLGRRLIGEAELANQLVVFDDDRFDGHVHLLTQLFDRLRIARVGRGEDEAVLATAQRQQAQLGKVLVGRQHGRHGVELVLCQVQQRHLVLAGHEHSEVVRTHDPAAHQFVDQLGAFLTRALFKLGK